MSFKEFLRYFEINLDESIKTHKGEHRHVTYDVIKELCKRNNISVNKLEQDLGFAKGSMCRIDVNKPSIKKIQRLSAYFSVPLDCFAPRNTGENQDDGLSQRDKRDIAKDLDKIMYEIYCELRDNKGIKDADVVRETGITKSTFSDWKNGRSKPKQDKLQKIADYFNVTLDYLTTGKEKPKEANPDLTAKDERDITKDLNRIMKKMEHGNDEPLSFNGADMSSTSMELLRNAIEYALTETKKKKTK